jgi:hypothetical protein
MPSEIDFYSLIIWNIPYKSLYEKYLGNIDFQ